jgi:NADPH:quinone reductase-like Zn-dependent oxidoreductase
MKALVATDYGGFENLRLVEIEKPIPNEGELLIKTTSVSVNPVDWKLLSGYRRDNLLAYFPYIIGWDLAGIVESRGHAARRFEIGDKVYGYIRRPNLKNGTYAEYVSVPECYVSTAPATISLRDAAAVPLAGLTALQSINKGHLQCGETILILGASGGVGTLAVQIARILGARVITVSSTANLAYLKSMGANVCLDYTDIEWVVKAKSHIPDFILDCAGGETLEKGILSLTKGGRVISLTTNRIANDFIDFSGVFVEPNSKDLDVLSGWINESKLTPFVSKYFNLDQAIEALQLNKEGRTRGKIVITMNK